MRYTLLLVRSDAEWEALTDAERDFDSIVRWWSDLVERGVMQGGAQLQPARTATTISWRGQDPVVTDGPFLEAKETIGGFGIIEVDTMEAAIEIAKTWPAKGHRIEIRPVVTR